LHHDVIKNNKEEQMEKLNKNLFKHKATNNKTISPMTKIYSIGDIVFSEKNMVLFFALIMAMLLFPDTVLASYTLGNNPFVAGVSNLASDAGPVFAALGIGVGGARAGYCAFRKAGCDESDYQKWDKGMRTAIVAGAICGGFGIIMTVLSSYFTFV